MINVKVILLGNSFTGKSSFINRLVYDTFSEFVEEEKIAETTYVIGNVKFTIFDSFSQERYRAINKIFIKKYNVIFFIYSITERSSFDEIKNFYYKEGIAHCKPHPSNNIFSNI